MTKSTHTLSTEMIVKFCELCDRAHELWVHHQLLFDNNPRRDEIVNSIARHEFQRLSIISQEYSLLQIRKLHDSAVLNGNITLGIDFVLKYGCWSDAVRSQLEALSQELNGFASQLRDVRNKVLSHNDLGTIVTGATLGAFPKEDAEKYFNDLQEFVNVVHSEIVGWPYPFTSEVWGDVAYFLRTIKPERFD